MTDLSIVQDFEAKMMAASKYDVDMATCLTPVNFEEAKTEFLANPQLRYPNFVYEEYDFSENLRGLHDIMRDYQVHANNLLWPKTLSRVLESYVLHIQHKLDVLNSMHMYRQLRVKDSVSARVLHERRTRIVNLNTMLNPAVNETCYRQIMHNLLKAQEDAVGFVPKPATVEFFTNFLKERWGKTFARVDFLQQEYTAEEVCDMVNAMITEDYGFKTPFRAVTDAKKKGLNVNQITYRLEIPVKRSNGSYTPQMVYTKVLGHENTHMYRAAHALNSYPVLALMLPGYEVCEEGITKCVEQALDGKYTLSGKQHYIALGSAIYDGMDFRDTYNRCLEISEKHGFGGLDVFNTVARSFRGTGDIPWTAGAVYFNGPQLVWRLIETMKSYPQALWSILYESGKTNIFDETHRGLLEEYGWNFADFLVRRIGEVDAAYQAM